LCFNYAVASPSCPIFEAVPLITYLLSTLPLWGRVRKDGEMILRGYIEKIFNIRHFKIPSLLVFIIGSSISCAIMSVNSLQNAPTIGKRNFLFLYGIESGWVLDWSGISGISRQGDIEYKSNYMDSGKKRWLEIYPITQIQVIYGFDDNTDFLIKSYTSDARLLWVPAGGLEIAMKRNLWNNGKTFISILPSIGGAYSEAANRAPHIYTQYYGTLHFLYSTKVSEKWEINLEGGGGYLEFIWTEQYPQDSWASHTFRIPMVSLGIGATRTGKFIIFTPQITFLTAFHSPQGPIAYNFFPGIGFGGVFRLKGNLADAASSN